MQVATFALLSVGAYAATVLKTSLALWFAVWAIRYKGELDHELNWGAKLLRWAIVVLAHGVVICGSNWLKYPGIRITVWGIGAAFLVWPNLAYHLFNALMKFKITRGA
jgi:hypothetical protein